jgi:hypothetical protein
VLLLPELSTIPEAADNSCVVVIRRSFSFLGGASLLLLVKEHVLLGTEWIYLG